MIKNNLNMQMSYSSFIPTGKNRSEAAHAITIRLLIAPQPFFTGRMFLLKIRIMAFVVALPDVQNSTCYGFTIFVFYFEKIIYRNSLLVFGNIHPVELFILIIRPFRNRWCDRIVATGVKYRT